MVYNAQMPKRMVSITSMVYNALIMSILFLWIKNFNGFSANSVPVFLQKEAKTGEA